MRFRPSRPFSERPEYADTQITTGKGFDTANTPPTKDELRDDMTKDITAAFEYSAFRDNENKRKDAHTRRQKLSPTQPSA